MAFKLVTVTLRYENEFHGLIMYCVKQVLPL